MRREPIVRRELLIGILIIFFLIIASFFVLPILSNLLREQRALFPIGCIAQIEIVGPITFENRAREIALLIKEADKRIEVRGILVLVNSPGGSAVASKELLRAIADTKKQTWIYMQDIATSGAYYVSIGADEIWADSASLTGSIGALAIVFEISELIEEIGINATIVKSGELKDFADILRPLTEKERKILEKIVMQIFDEFRDAVIKARSGNERFSIEKFNEVLDGRILTGLEAYEIGLIDGIGSYVDVLSALGEEVGLGPEPAVCVFAPKPSIFDVIFSALGRGIAERVSEHFAKRARAIPIVVSA